MSKIPFWQHIKLPPVLKFLCTHSWCFEMQSITTGSAVWSHFLEAVLRDPSSLVAISSITLSQTDLHLTASQVRGRTWLCGRMRNLVVRTRVLKKTQCPWLHSGREYSRKDKTDLKWEECEKRAEISRFQRGTGTWSPAVTQERLPGNTELIYVQMLHGHCDTYRRLWTPDRNDERADEWNIFLGAHL